MTKKQRDVLRRAGRMISDEQRKGDQLRIVSTCRLERGGGVAIRFNDGRTLPLSVHVLDMIERHVGGALGPAT